MDLPNDPVMLLSVVNTKLRDFYPDFETFCRENDLDAEEIQKKLSAISYEYSVSQNQFV